MSEEKSQNSSDPKPRSPAEGKPFKLRLPPLDNEDMIKNMDDLSPELAGLATWKDTMRAKIRYGENLFFSTVPEIFDADTKYFSRILALALNIDSNETPEEIWIKQLAAARNRAPEHHRWVLMMAWLFREHMNNGFARVICVGSMGKHAGISPTKILELRFPDSDIWSEDERLTLKFVKAIFTFSMTDELWDACVEAWGVRWILSISAVMVHYYGYALRYEMVGLDRVPGLTDAIPLTELVGMPLEEDA